jgi:hypothetical protein
MENAQVGSGKPGPGRPKGLQNKTTRAAKEAIALAADELGGAERMVAWAKEDPKNEAAFWTTIYPKLLPHTLAGDPDNPLTVSTVERRIVDANPTDPPG